MCSTSLTGCHDRGRVRGVRAQRARSQHLDSAPAAILIGAVLSVLLNNLIYTPFGRRGTTPIAMVIVALG